MSVVFEMPVSKDGTLQAVDVSDTLGIRVAAITPNSWEIRLATKNQTEIATGGYTEDIAHKAYDDWVGAKRASKQSAAEASDK